MMSHSTRTLLRTAAGGSTRPLAAARRAWVTALPPLPQQEQHEQFANLPQTTPCRSTPRPSAKHSGLRSTKYTAPRHLSLSLVTPRSAWRVPRRGGGLISYQPGSHEQGGTRTCFLGRRGTFSHGASNCQVPRCEPQRPGLPCCPQNGELLTTSSGSLDPSMSTPHSNKISEQHGIPIDWLFRSSTPSGHTLSTQDREALIYQASLPDPLHPVMSV
ncbi:hypothetical protein QBC34DRAFT_194018 [Podospora aff. communis PSN243]|uniref:Uncharacterized protein n=1 Tax=Podospora aff. communis PSN243 TaxID=3040156 RepID=A0AAV9H1J9_9PEZI|nr:hypothetical protein QBC34DRAFT_194018 [Podospora aff. communis PSN243]